MMRAAVAAILAINGAAQVSAQTTSPERDIRAARARSNAAIAAHDFEAMRQVFADGYTILPGSSGAPFGVEGFRDRLAPTFADPAFVTYLRTPDRITVAANGKRAAEVGQWVGTWRSGAGETRLSGVYQATWVPGPAGWRLRNESFVSLACTGERARCDVLF